MDDVIIKIKELNHEIDLLKNLIKIKNSENQLYRNILIDIQAKICKESKRVFKPNSFGKCTTIEYTTIQIPPISFAINYENPLLVKINEALQCGDD